jgi:hypothetical protein
MAEAAGGFLTVIKAGIIFALFLYLIFALVVVRQVQLMIETLEVGFEKEVMVLAITHLVFSIGIVTLAIVML